MVAKLVSLTNAYDFTLQKTKILNINFAQPAWTVKAYPLLNISFELTKRILFFEAFQLRIAVTEGFKTIPNGSFSFCCKLLKVP